MIPSEIYHQKILIAPLNWGLGHATRCIPIIKQLLQQDNAITIAGSGNSLILLRAEFPELPFYTLNDYNIKYYCNIPMWQGMGIQIPKIIKAIKQETKQLEEILKEDSFDLIISDNRYGLHNNKVKCIFITHQLFIKGGLFSNLLNYINHSYIKKFNYCWIPDLEDERLSLSGELSHGNSNLPNVNYIGMLSNIEKADDHLKPKIYKYCFLISGPEPQRAIFEEKCIAWANKRNESICIIRGTNEKQTSVSNNNIEILDLINSEEVRHTLLVSEHIICRSGYSTIMDLNQLNLKAIFIPTPGQTEQEYLAKYLTEKGLGRSVKQKDFTIGLELSDL